MTKVPYKFQQENIEAGKTRHLLISDDCGLGKTMSAVEIGKANRNEALMSLVPWRALIVCPKPVRHQWIREIQEQDPDIDVFVLEIHQEIDNTMSGWFITHYEAVVAHPPANVIWDYFVLDEAHRIKNRKAQRSQAVKRIQALRKVALTGTPMDKNPSDLWSILHWLYPSEFSSYYGFRENYCLMGENYLGYQIVLGPKNANLLAKKLSGRWLRHTKEMVAPELPPKVFIDVNLEMEGDQHKLYYGVKKCKDIDCRVEGFPPLLLKSALSVLVRLQQIASYPGALGPEFARPSVKVEWTLDFIDDHPELKIAVFTRFVATAQEILTKLKDGGVQADGYFGDTKVLPDPNVNDVMVCTIAKAGEGLDLKTFDVAIFVDQEWSTIKMQQAYDRIHRLGAKAPKMIYVLLASPSDVLVQEAIEKKWDSAQVVYHAIQQDILEVQWKQRV